MDVNTKQLTHRSNKRTISRAVLTASLLLTSLSLVGCAASAKSLIQGRVIGGPVGQSVGASPGDERFDEQGIPNAKITILSKKGNASRGRGVYTTATSDEYGNFELTFGNGQYPRDAIQVRVESEGIYTSRSQTFLPDEGDKMLCVVIPRPGYVIPVPLEPEKKEKK